MNEFQQYTLAIETAGKIPSVSLLKDSDEIDFSVGEINTSASESLVPTIKAILQKNDLEIGQISVFAVSNGPGSFTGVRIGLATVKGLILGKEILSIGVNTLEAIAFSAERKGFIRSVISAGRDEVFTQDFYFKEKYSAEEMTKPQFKKIENLIEVNSLNYRFAIVSDSSIKEKLLRIGFKLNMFDRPENLAKYIGIAGLESLKNQPLDLFSAKKTLKPQYVREADFLKTRNGK